MVRCENCRSWSIRWISSITAAAIIVRLSRKKSSCHGSSALSNGADPARDVFRRPCRAKNWLSRRPDPHDQPNIYYTFVQRPFWTEYALFLSTRQRLVLCQWCFDMWHSRPWLCNPSRTAEGGCATGGLHDKKAWQWCANLRQWAEKAQSELEVRILQSRAERRGRMTARSR
jgi:hypothetical protein